MERDVLGLERIEQEGWRQLGAIAPPAFVQGVGFEYRPMGGALFVMASPIPPFRPRQRRCACGAGTADLGFGHRGLQRARVCAARKRRIAPSPKKPAPSIKRVEGSGTGAEATKRLFTR